MANWFARKQPMAGPNAVVAAATVGVQQVALAKSYSGNWQDEAWEFYDTVGELRYAANWVGNALSRARLYVAKVPVGDDRPTPLDDDDAQSALLALAGGSAGHSELLKTLGVHMSIAGDSYLIGFDDPNTGTQRWVVRSSEEVRTLSDTVTIKIDGRDLMFNESQVVMVRIWRPHPRRSWEADSPTRGVLNVLYELDRLSQMVIAQATSRLAGAGMIILPAEFDFPVPADGVEAVPDDSVTPGPGDPRPMAKAVKLQTFLDKLKVAMVAPVSDRTDPSSIVPIVISAPGEHIKNIKLVTFWTPLDAAAIELRKEAIRRLALGLDMPAEVLLGAADVNRWNMWASDESSVKLHLVPLLSMICDALTVGFLQPLLGTDELMVWFDASDLIHRPNRGPEAAALYDRNEISGKTLRAASGFTEDDKPTEDEVSTRLLWDLIKGGGGVLAPNAANELGLLKDKAYVNTGPPAPTEAAPREIGDTPAPAPGDDMRDDPPSSRPDGRRGEFEPTSGEQRASVPEQRAVSMVPMLAAHALDYVGKRWLKGQPRGAYPRNLPTCRIHERIPVPEEKIDFLLAGAFAAFGGAVPDVVVEAVSGYVRHLTTTGTPYDPSRLMAALEGAHIDVS